MDADNTDSVCIIQALYAYMGLNYYLVFEVNSMKLHIFLFLLFFITNNVTFGEVVKLIDEDGNVYYTDKKVPPEENVIQYSVEDRIGTYSNDDQNTKRTREINKFLYKRDRIKTKRHAQNEKSSDRHLEYLDCISYVKSRGDSQDFAIRYCTRRLNYP